MLLLIIKCEDSVNARFSRKNRQVALVNTPMFQVCPYIHSDSF